METSTSVPGISYHAMILTDIDILSQFIRQKPRQFFIFSKANWDGITSEMKGFSESIINSANSSIDELWTYIRKMVGRKSRLHRHAKKTKQWGSYKAFQKERKKALKKAEINYINNTIQKGLDEQNTKRFWRYVKSRCQDFNGVPPQENGTVD